MMATKNKNNVTIVLVEDDETDVILFQRTCKRNGLEVDLVVATDGAEALQILRGENPEKQVTTPFIIMTDLRMDGMSGHEFIDQLRDDKNLKNSIVFVLSTSDLESDIERAYNAGISAYFLKDYEGVQLDSVVSTLDNLVKGAILPQRHC